jgi:hypothetical protein
MDRELEVHVELGGTTFLVGRLWSRSIKGRESATFEDDLNLCCNRPIQTYPLQRRTSREKVNRKSSSGLS